MQYHSSYKLILTLLACGCLFFLGIVLFHNTSSAYARSILATTTPQSTIVSTATPEARPNPTVINVSETSSFPDPASIIAIIGLIIAFIGLVVQAVTLFLIYRYVKDTAAMATATRDSANGTQVSAKVAENTLQEMKEARDEENAPSVVVYFNYIHSRRQTLYLVVENIGKSIARDIKLEFSPALQVSDFNKEMLENSPVLTNGIRSLVPNYKISIPFDYLMHYIHSNLPTEYTVKVTYWWKKSLPLQELEYVLDLNPYKHMDFVTDTGLGEIDETLQQFANHFSGYSSSVDTTNNLLNHIANAINRGLIIKNRVSVSHDTVDILTILKEFVYLWVVDYGKQTEKWNKSFIFGLRAKATLISEELLGSTVSLDSQGWVEQLKLVISNLSKLGSMQVSLDSPDGAFSSAPAFLFGGHSKGDFENLGDSIVVDIRTIIELINKEKEITLNGNYKEEALLPIITEEAD